MIGGVWGGSGGGGGAGDIVGPASSTDNAIALFDGATGKLLKNSLVIVSTAAIVTGITDLSINNGASATPLRLKNTNSGSGSTDGLLATLETNLDAQFWLYENANMIFATNNIARLTIASTGGVTAAVSVTTPSINLSATSNQLVLQSAGVTGTLTWSPASTNKTITLPNTTGTVALTSDLTNSKITSFGITIDGGGSVVATGLKGYIYIPYAATITGWTILGDQAGSCVVDILSGAYSAFPTLASIAGSEKPTISGSTKGQDLSLGTWTTALAADTVIGINVDSCSSITRINLSVTVSKT